MLHLKEWEHLEPPELNGARWILLEGEEKLAHEVLLSPARPEVQTRDNDEANVNPALDD
jgi:hypothetical protein